MQNRYVGDIGDFGKYGLLRYLLKDNRLKLGINWYLVPDETHNSDGGHISYLLNEKKNYKKFRTCDNILYDALEEIVKPKRKANQIVVKGGRNIEKIERSKLFQKVAFYNKYLDFSKNTRENWALESFETLKECDVIFFDPDNGLEVKSVGPYSKKSVKYVFFDELIPFWKSKKTLVIYQHSHFGESVARQIMIKFNQLKKSLNNCDTLFALRYHRGTSRFFLIAPSKATRNTILQSAKNFVNEAWGQHFDIVE